MRLLYQSYTSICVNRQSASLATEAYEQSNADDIWHRLLQLTCMTHSSDEAVRFAASENDR